LPDRFPAPDSASDLHFDISCPKDRLNLGSIITTSRHSIEIHDMKVPETVLSPRDGDADRVGDSNHLVVVGAGSELYASATAQVKRGNCDHWPRFLVGAWIMRGEGAAMDCMLASL